MNLLTIVKQLKLVNQSLDWH